MKEKLKKKYNIWLYNKYRREGNVPYFYSILPLWSPSLFHRAEYDYFSKVFFKAIKELDTQDDQN